MSWATCLGNALRAHGFATFATADASAAQLAPLAGALTEAQRKLVTLQHEGDWNAIATQLQAVSQQLGIVGVQEHDGSLVLVFGRVPPSYDTAREREFVEACGNWMKALHAKAASFSLSSESQQLALQAIGAAGANPLVVSTWSLLLAMSQFHGSVNAVVVDAAQTASAATRAAWGSADLTVDSGGTWTQLWLWEIASGEIVRGGTGTWDAPGPLLVDGFNTPADLARSIRQLCGGR